jgi:hypothetical protein
MEEITFFLALWGAFLSTYLALREIRKDKRSLKVILESVHWMETYRLVITNNGHRPITIDQISVELADKRYGEAERMPPGFLATESGERVSDALPCTLEDGKMLIFYFSEAIAEDLRDKNKFLRIEVFDAEGNVYNKYSKGEYDPKYGYRSGVYKPAGLLKTTATRVKYWWINKWQRN